MRVIRPSHGRALGVVTIEGAEVRTGTVAVANGGTGATTAAAAASAIGVGTEDSPTFTGLTTTSNATVGGVLDAGITTLSTSTSSPLLNLVSTEAGAGTGPVVEFYRNSATPADNDSLGWLEFYGEEETSSDKVRYAQFGAKIFDSGDGSTDGSFLWQMALNGTLTEYMKLSPTGFTFNEAGNAALDFRVESQYSDQALFLDAGAGTLAANVTAATFSGTVGVGSGSGATANTSADDLVVQSNGNTGISIMSPNANSSNLYFASAADNNLAYLEAKDDAATFKIGTTQTGHAIQFASGDNASAMAIDASQNVGIGVTSPAMGTNGSGLHIKGATHAVLKLESGADDESKIQFTENGTDQWRIGYDAASGHLEFTESGVADVLTLADGGNATFAGDIKMSGASGSINFTDTTKGIYYDGNELVMFTTGTDDYITLNAETYTKFAVNSLEKMRLTGDNLGINQSNPQNLLHITDTSSGALTKPIRLHNSATGASTKVGIEFTNSTDATSAANSAQIFCERTAGSANALVLAPSNGTAPEGTLRLETGGKATFAGSVVGNTFAAKTNPGVGNDEIYMGFSAPNGLIYSKNSIGAPASNISLGTTAADGTTSNVLTLSYDKSAQFASSIKLGGETAAANALDSYEEGTLTPQLQIGEAQPASRIPASRAYTPKSAVS